MFSESALNFVKCLIYADSMITIIKNTNLLINGKTNLEDFIFPIEMRNNLNYHMILYLFRVGIISSCMKFSNITYLERCRKTYLRNHQYKLKEYCT